jgi:hypothetical protein
MDVIVSFRWSFEDVAMQFIFIEQTEGRSVTHLVSKEALELNRGEHGSSLSGMD